jgi:GDPmannose 4,6-dehydratase
VAKSALIVGITVCRRLSAPNAWCIQHLLDRVTLLRADVLDQVSLIKAVEQSEPVELYNLAAMAAEPFMR